MPTRQSLLVTALVALLVTVSGCAALSGGSNVDAEQVLNQTQDGMSDVETFTFDAQMSMSAPQAGQAQNVSATGAVDIPGAAGRAQVDGPAQSLTLYVVNETMYMNMQGTWIKQNLANASANATANATVQPTATPQPDQFMNATSVSFEGNTTINGTDVYELSVAVDEEQLMNVTGQGGMGAMISVEDVSARLFVTHDEHRLKRINADMAASYMGQDTDMNLEVTLSDFNEDVTIDLPDAARNAESMGA